MSATNPRRLALDIETISPSLTPDDDPDFENPDDFQIAAIGLAYEGPEAGSRLPRTQIIFRRAPGLDSELDLLRRINSELWSYSPEEIVTFAGGFFDIPMLKKRPHYAKSGPEGDGLSGDISSIIQSAKSIDLGDYAAEAYGYGTTLDDLITHQNHDLRRTYFDDYDHGLDLDEIRPSDAEKDYVESSDIPGILETWLNTRSTSDKQHEKCNIEETEDLLTDYISGDIEFLLKISDNIPFKDN